MTAAPTARHALPPQPISLSVTRCLSDHSHNTTLLTAISLPPPSLLPSLPSSFPPSFPPPRRSHLRRHLARWSGHEPVMICYKQHHIHTYLISYVCTETLIAAVSRRRPIPTTTSTTTTPKDVSNLAPCRSSMSASRAAPLPAVPDSRTTPSAGSGSVRARTRGRVVSPWKNESSSPVPPDSPTPAAADTRTWRPSCCCWWWWSW